MNLIQQWLTANHIFSIVHAEVKNDRRTFYHGYIGFCTSNLHESAIQLAGAPPGVKVGIAFVNGSHPSCSRFIM